MSEIPTLHVLLLGAVLFVLGAVGLLVKRNLVVLFLCVELMLNAANLTFLAFAREQGGADAHAVVFLVVALAAAEAAVGLALVIAVWRTHRTLDIDRLKSLKES